MPDRYTVVIGSDRDRARIAEMAWRAPLGWVSTTSAPTRTLAQNDRMWAMLSDVARAKPQGRVLDTDTWKALFMAGLGRRVRFEPALDGQGVIAIGFRSSHLTKADMSDLIESIAAFGAEHGVRWSDEQEQAA